MDEHHTIWLKTLPESSETPDLTKSVCLIDHPIKSQKKNSKKEERVKHYEKGYRGILIRLLLTFGCISYYGLSLLPGDIRLYRRKLKEMQQEGIVELLRNNHKKLARLYHLMPYMKNIFRLCPLVIMVTTINIAVPIIKKLPPPKKAVPLPIVLLKVQRSYK